MDMDMNRSRDELAEEANRVRAELVDTVQKLDRIRRHPRQLGAPVARDLLRWTATGGVVLAAAGTLTFALRRREPRGVRLRRDRARLLHEAWARPDRILGGRERPFVVRLAQSLALALLTSALRALSSRWVARLSAARTASAR